MTTPAPLRAPSRARAGRQARASGEALQDALAAQHGAYLRAGLCDVRAVPTPVKVMGPTRPDGRGRTTFAATFAAKTHVDFMGTLADGRAVLIEAKSRAGDRLALADVAPQQVDALRWADAHGAVALLVVRLGGAVWCVPAQCLWGDGPRTWAAAHLDARGTRLRGVDWLGCV